MVYNTVGKEQYRMADSTIIYRYLHSGKGEVTLVNCATFKAHTYKFLKPSNEADFPEDTIFVFVMHEGRRLYIGMLTGYDFRRTARSTYGEDTESVKGARYIVKMSAKQSVAKDDRMQLYHSGRCCYCGRKLKSDKALSEGIGKKCKQYYLRHLLNRIPYDGN